MQLNVPKLPTQLAKTHGDVIVIAVKEDNVNPNYPMK